MMQHRRVLRLLPLCLLLLLASCADDPVAPVPGEPDPRLSPPDFPSLAERLLEAEGAAPDHIVTFRTSRVPDDFASRVAALGATVDRSYHGVGIATVEGLDERGVEALKVSFDVSAVEPNVRVQIPPTENAVTTAFDGPSSAADPTTAFFYPRQWNMRVIEADQAWAAGRLGSPDITVAILDTGIDYLYPDLAGLVDLDRSVSLSLEDELYRQFYFPDRHPVTDLHFHGTHVASTVASNGDLIAGVTSGVTLMGVKVLNVFGWGWTDDILAGIIFAVEQGADVINMSLAGSFDRKENPDLFKSVERALLYAWTHGSLVVVAAGNDAVDINGNGTLYETFCESIQVMCVTATGPTGSEGLNGPWTDVDAFAPYSNYGRYAVSVAAPGGTGFGLVWAACSTSSLQVPICQTDTFVLGIDGTSMAAPHVSGLAALVVEEIGRDRPLLVRTLVSLTAEDLGPWWRDPYYGWGRVNVAKALGLDRPRWGSWR